MRWRATVQSDVLVVCTGNVCRSPYVAARLTGELPALTVSSAGTAALVGQPPTAETSALLEGRATGVGGHAAAQLDRATARGASLVITAARRHRVEVVRLAPEAAGRTFTLLELARILVQQGEHRGLGLDRVVALAAHAVSQGEDRDYDDDLADPYRLSVEHYRQMAETVEAALSIVVPALRPGGLSHVT